MDPGDTLKERTVGGHREIDTRAREQVLAEEPDRRDRDARGNQRRTALAERRPHHVRRWRGRRRQPRHPQRADAHVVDQKIEQDHAGDANQQPAGEVTLRRLQLSGDEARSLPAAVGEQNRHQRRTEGRQPGRFRRRHRCRRGRRRAEAERHQHRDGADLEDHEDALKVAARAHAQAVHCRQHAQRTDRDGAFASGHAAQIAESSVRRSSPRRPSLHFATRGAESMRRGTPRAGETPRAGMRTGRRTAGRRAASSA